MSLRRTLTLCRHQGVLNSLRRLRSTQAHVTPEPSAAHDYTGQLSFVAGEAEPRAAYRVLDSRGAVAAGAAAPALSADTLERMYTTMVQVREMDRIFYESQRQGRISFYMTNGGEEGIQAGSAAALSPSDLVFAQYREAGVLLYRGYSVRDVAHQCFGTKLDPGKGRQMPVHYGCKELNFVTISSPLATQLPQAVGAAYAYKRASNNERVVACYFGDGAASEGDAHAAFNFAATLRCPVLFICRNNGFAISTPTSEQYAGDGVAAHGPAYGVRSVRVDGTDALAVYGAVADARAYALRHNKPVLIEAMAYRVGHHSTSDDSSAYRSPEEAERWARQHGPINKFRLYMENNGWWNEDRETQLTRSSRTAALQALAEAEKTPRPDWREMFRDVYDEMPKDLRRQQREMEAHVAKYSQHYPLDMYAKED